jgi:hypothetical protein
MDILPRILLVPYLARVSFASVLDRHVAAEGSPAKCELAGGTAR